MRHGPRAAQRSAAVSQMSARQIRVHYLIAGSVLGGLWFLNRDMPLWEHGMQMLIFMVTITVLQAVIRRRHGASTVPASAYVRQLGAKVALIPLAVVASWALSQWTSSANTIVAAGLVLIVAVLGPAAARRGRTF